MSSSRGPPYKTGSRRREKKAEQRIATEYLDDALTDFSGYIAADELYDGPFCVLFIVDNHNFRRLMYEVLDHDPTHEDILRFFRRFRKELDARDLTLLGVTTDGSPLYPEPLRDVLGNVPHQICEFHVLKEILREVLKALAEVRRELKNKQPKLKRGRPSSKSAKRAARKKKRLQRKIADLFAHRHLFVKHSLTPREKAILRRITRGLPQLRKLRSIVDEVYRLFDRRCRTETALEKLAGLRRRVRRFRTLGQTLRKLFTPNIEKALTFLDDSLLPATSNAVERANRRHRKMQKSIYRVRTREHISQRIAVDMQREAQAEGRFQTTTTLHLERNGISCSR
ncbi:MAG: transposase [Phycisphaerae bacterium]|nr:transposase [Phycisphaerae bacterium]